MIFDENLYDLWKINLKNPKVTQYMKKGSPEKLYF